MEHKRGEGEKKRNVQCASTALRLEKRQTRAKHAAMTSCRPKWHQRRGSQLRYVSIIKFSVLPNVVEDTRRFVDWYGDFIRVSFFFFASRKKQYNFAIHGGYIEIYRGMGSFRASATWRGKISCALQKLLVTKLLVTLGYAHMLVVFVGNFLVFDHSCNGR